MDEVSDKTLVVLIIIAIVISFSGTLISLNRLSQLGIPITGMGTTGIANLTISTGTSIAVSNNIVFGSGVVNTSYATLESNASDYKTNGTGTWDWGVLGFGGQAFVIVNDGNVNVSINASTNVSRAAYIAGTNPLFGAAISYEETNACQGTGTNAVQIVSWKEINNTQNVTLCRNLTPSDASDQINVSLRLGIPENAPYFTDQMRATITFYGYTGEDG